MLEEVGDPEAKSVVVEDGGRDGHREGLREGGYMCGLREEPRGSRGHGGREKVTCEDGWTSTSELGGALEEVVVEELLKKNKDLQEQVARLMEERKKGSEPSWSEVVGLTTPARRPGGKPIYSPYFHVRAESYSEFGSSW